MDEYHEIPWETESPAIENSACWRDSIASDPLISHFGSLPTRTRPFNGRSKTFLFSITWPSEEVSNSSIGAVLATSTVSDTLPGSIVIGSVNV